MTALNYKNQSIIITGASSGIGAAFAHELAKRGSNVILVARRLDRLTALAHEMREQYGVMGTAIAIDLSAPRAGRRLADEVASHGLNVTGLINNAGFGTDGPFHEEDPDRLADEINVNIANLVDLSHAFVGQLRAAPQGLLINVASMAAYVPAPGMATYAATKAFVLNFTEALWYESRHTGLRVLSLAPGLTRTEFFDDLASGSYNGNYQTPDQVVHTALGALDRGRGPSIVSGRRNALTVAATRIFSRKRAVRISGSATARSQATAVKQPA